MKKVAAAVAYLDGKILLTRRARGEKLATCKFSINDESS